MKPCFKSGRCEHQVPPAWFDPECPACRAELERQDPPEKSRHCRRHLKQLYRKARLKMPRQPRNQSLSVSSVSSVVNKKS